eukprot:scaffold4420_cov187-Amphora_coffeaeformis.AAC.26
MCVMCNLNHGAPQNEAHAGTTNGQAATVRIRPLGAPHQQQSFVESIHSTLVSVFLLLPTTTSFVIPLVDRLIPSLYIVDRF